MIFYDFGPYDLRFSRYWPKKKQTRVTRQTESSLEVTSGLYVFLRSYSFIVILLLLAVGLTILEL